jgi:ATP-binding cassette subfamily B (MDR/TAP) protein 1
MASSLLPPEGEQISEGVVAMRPDERAILDRQLHGLPKSHHGATDNSGAQQYASTSDKVVIGVSAICALVAGALNPLVPVSCATLVPQW